MSASTVYLALLTLHSWVRWTVIILAFVALVGVYRGWLRKLPWTDSVRRIGVFFGSALDTQLLLGLLLYLFFSPITQAAFNNWSMALSTPMFRFFTIEHLAFMTVAVVLVHVGSMLSQRAEEPAAKYRTSAIFFTVAILLVLVAIPWSRPILRLGSGKIF